MKNLILIIFFALVSMNSFGFTVKVEKVTDDDAFQASNYVKFKTDKSGLNRAWIEVNVDTDDIDEVWTTTERMKVPGLSFDPKKSAIVLENKNEVVVCANVTTKTRRSIFTGRTIVKHKVKSTKKCEVNARVEERKITYDDGFDLRTKKVNYLVVEITTL